MAGEAWSNNGDVSGNHSLSDDAWVVKLDDVGTIQWQKALGGTGVDIANAVQQTADGGYIVAGSTDSNNGDVSGNHGGGLHGDAWVVKLGVTGNIQWQKCIGGSSSDRANAIQTTADGGYIMAAETYSNDGDVSGNHGWADAWVVKLGGTGTIQWQKALGGTDAEFANAVQQTADGGYIMAGYTNSNDGDVSGNHYFVNDAWMVKLDGTGTIQWQQTLGGTANDWAWSVQQTTDGGYIMAGEAISNDGDVTGNHNENLGGAGDAWVVKLGPDWIGINELSDPDLAMHPDPTTGPVYLTWNKAQGSSIVSILDATGRLLEVVREAGAHCVLDLSSRRSGVYLVKVVFADGTQAIKRVVRE